MSNAMIHFSRSIWLYRVEQAVDRIAGVPNRCRDSVHVRELRARIRTPGRRWKEAIRFLSQITEYLVFFFLKSSLKDMLREEGGDTLISESNMVWLPLIRFLTGNPTHELGMCP